MTKLPSPRPLSIKLIAIVSLMDGLLGLPEFLSPQPSTHNLYFLGISTSGQFTLVYDRVQVLLLLYIGIGLWRLWEITRRVAVGYESFLALNTLLSWLNPSQWTVAAGTQTSLPASALMFIRIQTTVLLVVFSGLKLWFLIKRKSAFVKSTMPTQASTIS